MHLYKRGVFIKPRLLLEITLHLLVAAQHLSLAVENVQLALDLLDFDLAALVHLPAVGSRS